ncbi:MAG: hypothetical protein ACR2N3_06815 [Pyrinomonadaceae bacterium]
MKNQRFVTTFSLLMSIALFGFGYVQTSAGYFQSPAVFFQPISGDSQTTTETKTKITQDILKKSFTGKNVGFIVGPPDKKPNPLLLRLKIVKGGSSPKISLNGTDYELGELIQKLQSVFKEREENGFFIEGTKVIDKRVTLAASKTDINFYNKENIYVEDFERLVDELQKEGIDQIYVR